MLWECCWSGWYCAAAAADCILVVDPRDLGRCLLLVDVKVSDLERCNVSGKVAVDIWR